MYKVLILASLAYFALTPVNLLLVYLGIKALSFKLLIGTILLGGVFFFFSSYKSKEVEEGNFFDFTLIGILLHIDLFIAYLVIASSIG